jgi:hypothetical protein
MKGLEKMARQINVCPNCGLILEGPEFLTSVSKMAENVGMSYDPVAGRFLCPRCNYSGIPIEVKDTDYKKLKFENKPIPSPLNRMNPLPARLLLILWIALLAIIFLLPFASSLQIDLLLLVFFLACLTLAIPTFKGDKRNMASAVLDHLRELTK